MKLYQVLFIIATMIILVPEAAKTQNADTDSLNNYLIAVPIIYRTPETSWAFGVGGAYNYFQSADTLGNRPSQFQLGAVYTLLDQLLLYLPFQLYFDNNRFNINGEIGYYYYTYFYYGIGNQTLLQNEETYLASYPRIKFEGLYGLSKYWFAGVSYDFDYFQIPRIKEAGLLDAREPTGYEGGVVSELGLISIYDRRDNVFYPSRGLYLQTDLYAAWEGLGSISNYYGWKLDFRKYFSLPFKHTLAAQWVWENKNGNVPFFRLAFLGGPKLMRGYIEGRFRDKNMSLFQLAYRLPLFWRIKMEAFATYGAVNDRIFLPLQQGHFAYGAGLRLLVDRSNQLHVRVDYARGSDQSGFYLTIGEAF